MFCEGAAVSGRASRLKAYTAVFSAGLVMGMAVGIAGALVWGALVVVAPIELSEPKRGPNQARRAPGKVPARSCGGY